MAMSQPPSDALHEEQQGLSHEFQELLSTLPRENGWQIHPFYQYQGFWYPPEQIQGMLASQQSFQARDDDILLVTTPKSGTTWLKALAFAILNRTRYQWSQHPLLTNNPHQLVPYLELELHANNQVPDIDDHTRLLSSHLPYASLPESVKNSNCKVIYLCRNPKDTFISFWHFMNKLTPKPIPPLPLDVALDLFCAGVSVCGPFWDHVLGYWKASLERPQQILFLKFEDMKKEQMVQLRNIADFLGHPFSPHEERERVSEEILRLCSFENLSNLEVNKTGTMPYGVEHRLFFRRGEIGDSANYLTPQMIQRLDGITEGKFRGTGLTFEYGEP